MTTSRAHVARLVDVDADALRRAIKDEYGEVARDPGRGFHLASRGVRRRPPGIEREHVRHRGDQLPGEETLIEEWLTMEIRRSPCLAVSLSGVLCLTGLLFLIPAATAQVTTGTTGSGLYYESSGTGDAVVLVHAFSVDRRMWAPQVAALEGRFRVIRYDLRGHGKSAAPSTPYAAHEDLRSVLDALSIRQATLVGLSAGAALATDFAIVYPERVVRLVLAAPGLGGYVPSTPLTSMQPVFQAAAAGDAERAATLWVDTPIMALRNDGASASTVRDLVMSNVRLWTYRTNPVQPLTPPAATRLTEVKCPTLVVIGDQDLPHIKDVARLLVDGIPGAGLVTIPGAGHLVNLDAPAAFNQSMTSFLRAPQR